MPAAPRYAFLRPTALAPPFHLNLLSRVIELHPFRVRLSFSPSGKAKGDRRPRRVIPKARIAKRGCRSMPSGHRTVAEPTGLVPQRAGGCPAAGRLNNEFPRRENPRVFERLLRARSALRSPGGRASSPSPPSKGTPSPRYPNQCLFRTVGVPILNRRADTRRGPRVLPGGPLPKYLPVLITGKCGPLPPSPPPGSPPPFRLGRESRYPGSFWGRVKEFSLSKHKA